MIVGILTLLITLKILLSSNMMIMMIYKTSQLMGFSVFVKIALHIKGGLMKSSVVHLSVDIQTLVLNTMRLTQVDPDQGHRELGDLHLSLTTACPGLIGILAILTGLDRQASIFPIIKTRQYYSRD